MGLWDKIKGEFIDIIEWTDNTSDTIIYRFERHGNEIKYGAKLTVRESQEAVFINEGQLADVFKPGMYTLETKNVPLLSTLQGWKYGFSSPFKAEVYFVNTKNFTDQKWGTKNPFTLRDPDFGVIRLKAFGSFAFKITDAAKFIKEVSGTDGDFDTSEIYEQLKTTVITRFTDAIGTAKIPALDLASNYSEISQKLIEDCSADFAELGIKITKFLVENISFPPEVEAMIDKKSSMGILGDLNKFNQFQTGISMEAGAKNPNGNASEGIGMGMGFAMANQMNQMMNQNNQNNQVNQQQNNNQMPPPPPPATTYFVAVNGQQTGPFDLNALAGMAKNNAFSKESLVWKTGMASWTAAGQVTELSSIFNNVPPPIPG